VSGHGDVSMIRSPVGANINLAAQPAAEIDPEVVAVIGAALAFARRLRPARTGLGAALQLGPGAWWVAGQVSQQDITWWRMPRREQAILASPNLRIKVVVNGHSYQVEVGDPCLSPVSVNVDGQLYQVALEPDTSSLAPVPAPGQAARPSPPDVAPALGTPASASTSGHPLNQRHVKAPMPGTILDIAVKPGDRVSTRQTLCWLEAMKMKNAIRAPRAGVIASVHVCDGQAVASRDVLFTFE